jgi:hypothetical protein
MKETPTSLRSKRHGQDISTESLGTVGAWTRVTHAQRHPVLPIRQKKRAVVLFWFGWKLPGPQLAM